MVGSSFQRWAESWSRLGLWLTLWDEKAERSEKSPTENPFWETLFQHSKRCRERLTQLARQALQDNVSISELEQYSGVTVIAVPIYHRHRVIGSVLACGLTQDFFDQETFARFCSIHQVDRLVFEKMAADLPSHTPDNLHAYGRILQDHLEAFGNSALSNRDIHDLSSHLAQTYEELNLLYRLSTSMSVSKRPQEHLEKLCSELLSATVAESFAAIFEPNNESPGEPMVVKAGPLKAESEEVLKLYRQVRAQRRNAGATLVINDLADEPQLAWAGEWLERLVFVELSSNDQTFGGMLAINRADNRDFGSEAIQLINAVAERSSAFLENVRLYDDLEQLFMGMLHALVNSIDAKDPYTCGHSQRVAWLSRHIASLAGVSEAQSQRVYLSGLLHDIGKIGIAESVLRKTGRLTPEEFLEMKRHPQIGAHILESVRQVEDVVPGVLHHHERLDGKGYPARLSGEDVPFLGRVIGLADGFDAMTSDRTYRRARPIQIAAAEIRRYAGTQFDPLLADLLLNEDLEAISRKMGESSDQPIGPHTGFTSRAPRGESP